MIRGGRRFEQLNKRLNRLHETLFRRRVAPIFTIFVCTCAWFEFIAESWELSPVFSIPNTYTCLCVGIRDRIYTRERSTAPPTPTASQPVLLLPSSCGYRLQVPPGGIPRPRPRLPPLLTSPLREANSSSGLSETGHAAKEKYTLANYEKIARTYCEINSPLFHLDCLFLHRVSQSCYYSFEE